MTEVADAIVAGIASEDTPLEQMSAIVSNLERAGYAIVPAQGSRPRPVKPFTGMPGAVINGEATYDWLMDDGSVEALTPSEVNERRAAARPDLVALINKLWSQFYDNRPAGDPKDTYREIMTALLSPAATEGPTLAQVIAWLRGRPGISWEATISDIGKALAALVTSPGEAPCDAQLIIDQNRTIQQLRAQVEELKACLQPFAKTADWFDNYDVPEGSNHSVMASVRLMDLRRARSLTSTERQDG